MLSRKRLLGFIALSSVGLIGMGTNSQATSASVSLNNSSKDVTVSEVMIFNQLIDQVAKDFNISKQEAQLQLGFSKEMTSRAIESRATYRTLSQQFTVNSSYKPTMRFYCETTESGAFRTIKKFLK